MKKRGLLIFCGLCIIGLIVWKYVHRPVELAKQPIILGHGGMGVRSPYTLDSKKSIQKALTYPIDGSEIDVQMTSDNVLIAYHDRDLPIHSGCPGSVWEKTYAQLYACCHGVFHKGEPLECLDSLLLEPWKSGTVFSLDLKPEPDMDSLRMVQFRSALVRVTQQFPQYTFLLEAQDLTLLRDLKLLGIESKLFYYTQSPEKAMIAIQENQLDGISINAAFISKAQILEAQNANIKVMIWGTGSVFSNREFLGLDADIIQTDAIASMVKLLDR